MLLFIGTMIGIYTFCNLYDLATRNQSGTSIVSSRVFALLGFILIAALTLMLWAESISAERRAERAQRIELDLLH